MRPKFQRALQKECTSVQQFMKIKTSTSALQIQNHYQIILKRNKRSKPITVSIIFLGNSKSSR